MHDYELMVILNPQMDPDQVKAAVERIQRSVTQRGGEVTHQQEWGAHRRLAYPINHFREGNYILTRFRLDPAKAQEVRETLRLSEEVLRHLLVKIEA